MHLKLHKPNFHELSRKGSQFSQNGKLCNFRGWIILFQNYATFLKFAKTIIHQVNALSKIFRFQPLDYRVSENTALFVCFLGEFYKVSQPLFLHVLKGVIWKVY